MRRNIRTLLRRLRGILGIAVIWSAGWSVLGAVINTVRIFLSNQIPLRALLSIFAFSAAAFAVWGFIAGVAFGFILATTESRGLLNTLRVRRMAIWGGVAGVFPGLMLTVWSVMNGRGIPLGWDALFIGVLGLAGSAFAAASLKLALASRSTESLRGSGSGEAEDALLHGSRERPLLQDSRVQRSPFSNSRDMDDAHVGGK